MTTRIQATIDDCRVLADTGQEPQRTWVADGFLEHDEGEIAWIRRHRDLFN